MVEFKSHHPYPHCKFLSWYQELLCPVVPHCTSRMRSQPQLRNDKYIMMQYTNWINSTLSQQQLLSFRYNQDGMYFSSLAATSSSHHDNQIIQICKVYLRKTLLTTFLHNSHYEFLSCNFRRRFVNSFHVSRNVKISNRA